MPFPSDKQSKVIEHRGPPLVVVAGPGTGKTKTIVHRMLQLLSENSSRNITFVTFTRTSRSDTSEKLAHELAQEYIDDPQAALPRVGTLHATAKSIFHQFSVTINHSPYFTIFIAEKGERLILIKEVINDLDLGLSEEVVNKGIISFFSNGSIPEFSGIPRDLWNVIIDRYERLIKFYKAYGMEEIIYYSCTALENSVDSVPPIFLQVDEYQDLNPTDQHFIDLIASNRSSQVIVVGDDAQSIYKFRHANFQKLRELWDSDQWEHVRFLDCFRLPPHIQRAALDLISDRSYLGSKMIVKDDNGRRIKTYQCTRSEYQPIVIAQSINEFLDEATKDNGDPVTYSDIMVLCPSGNFVPSIIETFKEYGIPAVDVSRSDIPSDIWRLILVLRMVFQNDNLALRRWLDIAGIENAEIEKIRLSAMNSEVDLFSYLEHSENEQLNELLTAIRDIEQASLETEELLDTIVDFPCLELNENQLYEILNSILNEEKLRSPNMILPRLYQKFGVLEDERDTGDEDLVLISTLHKAKGLEGELVCILWMNKRYLPMENRDPEEQRRLLYVAMTRPKQELILSFHERYDPESETYYKSKVMSPFLHEIIGYLDIERIRASDIK